MESTTPRTLAIALSVAMSLQALPLTAGQEVVVRRTAAQGPGIAAASAPAQGQSATISGTAVNSTGEVLENVTVQARDLVTGQVVGSTSTAANGLFSLIVNPGNYVIEIVDSAGQIIGTSAFISVAAGTAVTTATVVATTTLVTAAATSTALVVTAVAAAAGVAGVVAPPTRDQASPSR